MHPPMAEVTMLLEFVFWLGGAGGGGYFRSCMRAGSTSEADTQQPSWGI